MQHLRHAHGWRKVLLLCIWTAGALQGSRSETITLSGPVFADDKDLQTLLRSTNKSVVFTLAGNGFIGAADGSGKDASFYNPSDIILLTNQRSLLVADTRNHKIRLITLPQQATSSAGKNPWLESVTTVTTLAGSGTAGLRDGVGTNAQFNLPSGIDVHPDGTWAAIADKSNHRIRRVYLASGAVDTLAGVSTGYQDGTNRTAKFKEPSAVLFTSKGDALVIADSSNNRIRWLDLQTGHVKTLAGSRIKTGMCAFGNWFASGGCTGGSCLCGNRFAIGPRSECQEVDWDVDDTPTLLCQYGANNKSCTEPASNTEGCVCTSPNTGQKCILDSDCTLKGICLGAAGYADGAATLARFNNPTGLTLDPDGTSVYVADSNNQVVRRVELSTGIVSTVAGAPGRSGNIEGPTVFQPGDEMQAEFSNPTNAVFFSPDLMLVADTENARIRSVSTKSKRAVSLTGWLTCQFGSYTSSGICYTLSPCTCTENVTDPKKAVGCQDFSNPYDKPDQGKSCLCTPPNKGASCNVNNDCVGRGTCLTGSIGGAVDGEAWRAKFNKPQGLALDKTGSFFAVCDSRNHRIRMVDCGGPCVKQVYTVDPELTLQETKKSSSPHHSASYLAGFTAGVVLGINVLINSF